MKKTVKLNESDLERLVKKIIEEDNKSLDEIKMGSTLGDDNFEVGGDTIDAFQQVIKRFKEVSQDMDMGQYRKLSQRLGKYFLGT